MMPFRRLISWPKRRWRSRGFGIHSPFAYDFVTGTLAPRRPGGCDEALRGLPQSDFKRLRLLYRCVRKLRPDMVAVYPEADETMLRVIRLASAGHPVEVISASQTPSATPGLYFISGIDREPSRAVWKHVTTRHDRGMDFSDMRTGIFCPYPHLPRQSFRIVFR